MILTKLRPGDMLPVPAGADLLRRQAYAVRVVNIWNARTGPDGTPCFFVYGERLRVDGTPTRRKGKTIATFVRPERAGRIH